jgi:hypothetical protein
MSSVLSLLLSQHIFHKYKNGAKLSEVIEFSMYTKPFSKHKNTELHEPTLNAPSIFYLRS